MNFYNANLKDNPLIVNSYGPWLVDKNGNHLFDCWLGAGTLLYGHAHSDFLNTTKMLPELHIPEECKNLINKLVDFKVGSLGIQTSGSSAITRACRIARALTSRRLVALIGEFWHGSDDEFLFRHNHELLSAGLNIKAGENYRWFENISDFLDYPNLSDFAAILVEPFQGSNPKKNVVSELLDSNKREFLRKENILIIFDEIITGFRESYGSSLISRKCHPDIVVFGKVLAGGYPIGMVLVDEECRNLEIEKKIFWGGTFSANPIQVETMFIQLNKLIKLDFNLILANLDDLCNYLVDKIKIDNIGFTISKGRGFARILESNKKEKSSRGFLFKKTDTENKLEKLCLENKIYIPRNRLIFSSCYNINENLHALNQ